MSTPDQVCAQARRSLYGPTPNNKVQNENETCQLTGNQI